MLEPTVRGTAPWPAPPPADPAALFADAAAALASRVPFDALHQGTTDPESGLIDSGYAHGSRAPALRRVVDAEYGHADVNPLSWLATRPEPLGLLSGATGGELDRSHRYRTILRGEGLRHELRIALVARGVCWGYQVLYRKSDRQDFGPTEVNDASEIAAGLTDALVARARAIPVEHLSPERVGVLSLDGRGTVDAVNEVAQDIVASSGSQRCPDTGLPLPLVTFATALIGGRLSGALMPDPSLGWLRLTGNTLRIYRGGNRFTVSVQAASPLTVAPYLLYARGATPRSVAVTLRVLRGMTSAEIAEDLAISRYTVQDHLKPVFSALAVNSRRELLGSLFPRLRPHQVH